MLTITFLDPKEIKERYGVGTGDLNLHSGYYQGSGHYVYPEDVVLEAVAEVPTRVPAMYENAVRDLFLDCGKITRKTLRLHFNSAFVRSLSRESSSKVKHELVWRWDWFKENYPEKAEVVWNYYVKKLEADPAVAKRFEELYRAVTPQRESVHDLTGYDS